MLSLKRQRGFTIIELMIAILLGMLMMAGVLQFILSTNQTYALNDDVSRIQENGRIALDILSKDLQRAGHPPLTSPPTSINMFLEQCTSDANGNTRPCTNDGGGTTSDRLSVQYSLPPTVTTDCQGTAVTAGDTIVNVYTIQTNSGISSLYCRGYNVSTASFISNAAPLVDGIDNFQVLYKVEDGATAQYKSASALSSSDHINISAARIGVLVSSGLAQGSAESKTRSYNLLSSGLATYPNDSHPRRIYTTTVQFNNYF